MDVMAELRDVRAKITAESDQMLDAISRASGRDKSELIREVLHEWYVRHLEQVRMIVRLCPEATKGTGRAGRGGDAE